MNDAGIIPSGPTHEVSGPVPDITHDDLAVTYTTSWPAEHKDMTGNVRYTAIATLETRLLGEQRTRLETRYE